MPTLVTSHQVEEVLREMLAAEGYSVSLPRVKGETGVDLLAERGADCVHIETVSHKSSPPTRARDFFEVFFRAVSRLDDGAAHCVIALPHLSARGLPARARQYRTAWQRIAEAFPELAIWVVNAENRRVERTTWLEWLSRLP